jgi:hypothetical protein
MFASEIDDEFSLKTPGQVIDGLRFHKTCGACPEQYDVYDAATGELKAYMRLRHGVFRVDVPDCFEETVLEATPTGADGAFADEEQRQHYLQRSADAINAEFTDPASALRALEASERIAEDARLADAWKPRSARHRQVAQSPVVSARGTEALAYAEGRAERDEFGIDS